MSVKITLKHPIGAYQPRLTRFLELMVRVRALTPPELQLWQVMDMPCFEDTETALETALFNEKTAPQQPGLTKGRLTRP